MSVYAVPTTAEVCMREFISRLSKRIAGTAPEYTEFMPILSLLLEQSESRIDIVPVNRLIGGLSQKAQTKGADAISYLRSNWGPGLLAKSPSPKKVTPQKIVTVTNLPESSSSSSSSSITVTNVPQRALIRDAAEQGGGTVVFSWAQSSLFQTLGIPRDTWNGFCAMAVGEFFVRPDTIQTTLRSQKGKIDLLHLHSRYGASGEASYEYITAAFGLTFVNATSVTKLTPQNTLLAMETFSGTRHMIGLLKSKGGGHAIGVIVNGGTYNFFDAEEGQATLGDRNSFWQFLYRYITHETKGLDKDFQNVFVATWS